jgi:hypothetical protein
MLFRSTVNPVFPRTQSRENYIEREARVCHLCGGEENASIHTRV